MSTRAIRIHRTGGPDVLALESVELSPPANGEVRIRHTAIGVNFIDVYHRTGLYPVPAPFTPGLEAAGVVEAIGAGVSDIAVGDRVAYASRPIGAYANARNMPADRLVRLPREIDERIAAAAMLKGMTAEFLLRRTFRVEKGHTVLVHAAAGGVGTIACQWAHHLGARVIGTVGSEAKAALAKQNGCEHPIVYTKEDFVARVRELTNGRGVDVVYDSVGKDTFAGSLECLAFRGMLVSFGQSSGKIAPIDLLTLTPKAAYVTRPSLMEYTAKREDLVASASALFDVIGRGVVKIHVDRELPLSRARDAHRLLEERKTHGSIVLTANDSVA